MLNLAKLGIQQEKNRIVINDQFQTNIPNIYAVGDLVDGHMLAHKASAEAVMAAEVIAGKKVSRADIKTIPNVLYTKPEIASVGMDEETAAKNNIETITGKFPLSALGRSATVNESQGYLKYIACKESHRIIAKYYYPYSLLLLVLVFLCVRFCFCWQKFYPRQIKINRS